MTFYTAAPCHISQVISDTQSEALSVLYIVQHGVGKARQSMYTLHGGLSFIALIKVTILKLTAKWNKQVSNELEPQQTGGPTPFPIFCNSILQ